MRTVIICDSLALALLGVDVLGRPGEPPYLSGVALALLAVACVAGAVWTWRR